MKAGFYTLILRSRDAVKEGTPAYRFRVKVTNEILPAIRKTGSYSAATLTPAEQLQIRKAISARAKKSAVAYQTIYHALYARFQVAKYDQSRAKPLIMYSRKTWVAQIRNAVACLLLTR